MVITFDNVSFKYIDKYLLENVSFSLTENDKVGIVGLNGVGKSTLLKLILERETPNNGSIVKSGNIIINYLEQNPIFEHNKKLIDIILDSQTKEHPIKEYEASSILTKLKLNPEDCCNNFSGGELKRLALAKVLVSYCDFLILDEPTNHLDNEVILWLEKYLIKFKRGLIMVTHDRYFLERVCNKMLEIDDKKVYLYDANYTKFLELKEERIIANNKAQQKLKSILRNERKWANRGCEARRTKNKDRLDRLKELEKIEFSEQKEFSFSSVNTYLGKKLIEIEHGYKAYDKALFKDFNFKLERQDIIAIVGKNGAGKSTLFNIIMKNDKLDSGNLILGDTLRIGYFSQQLDFIDPEIRVIDYIEEDIRYFDSVDGKKSSTELLDEFLFDESSRYQKVKTLSGGEKRRLQLIKVLATNPNLLILDEPTNDLDIYTLEMLENYIIDFRGPVLIVSHDRYLLDKVANKLLAFEDENIKEYNLSFSEYLNIEKEVITTKKDNVKYNTNKMSSKDRNLLNKLNEEVPLLETKLKSLKDRLSKLTTEYTEIMELSKEIEDLESELDEKIITLLELEELKESFNR